MIQRFRRRLFTSVSLQTLNTIDMKVLLRGFFMPQDANRKQDLFSSVPLLKACFLPVFSVPVPQSSFHVLSTATTAQLTWKLHRLQSVSTLTLYNTRTQPATRVFHANPPEMKSQYTMKGLQPGTSFKVEVTVATFLPNAEITLKQKLNVFLETGFIFYSLSFLEQVWVCDVI